MNKREIRRQQILERLADHVLAHGLQGASLRPLATAAGTSDRMLLHYFVDKEELLTATLTLVTRRLIALLEASRVDSLPFDRLLPLLAGLIQDARVRPYLSLWLELVALASGGREPFRAIAQQIYRTLVQWIATRLAVQEEEQRAALAALTLAIIEGFIIFDALGDDTAHRAALAGLALGPAAWRGMSPPAPDQAGDHT